MPYPVAAARGKNFGGPEYYVTEPQNLLASAGTLAEDFETTTGWTANSGSIANDATNFKTGTQSIQQTSPVGTIGRMTKAWVPGDLSSCQEMRLWFYCADPTKVSSSQIQIMNAAGSKYFYNYLNVKTGWNLASIKKADWSINNGMTWTEIGLLRMAVTPVAGQAGVISFDSLYINVVSKPALVITFDDAHNSVYDNAFAYTRLHNVPCTFYVQTGAVNGANAVTNANLTEMKAAGWSICNHTQNHTDLTTLAEAEVVTELNAGKTDLEGWGFSGNDLLHVAYPGGAYNDTVISAMATYGALTGRTVETTGWYDILPFPQAYRIHRTKQFGNTLTLAQAKTWIDSLVSRKEVGTALFHTLVAGVPGSATQWNISDFQSFIAYIVQQRLPCITIDEAYRLQSGSVRCRLPV